MLDDFFEYILDMIWSSLENAEVHLHFKNAFFHGSLFNNETIMKLFGQKFETNLKYAVRKKRLSSLLSNDVKYKNPTTYGLALTASELLSVKKDPLVRILRYILYNYE